MAPSKIYIFIILVARYGKLDLCFLAESKMKCLVVLLYSYGQYKA